MTAGYPATTPATGAGRLAPAERAAALTAAAVAAAGGLAAAHWGPVVLLALVAGALFAITVWRPVAAVYVYLVALPFLAGIDRGVALPLVRPNEAVLALVVAGAVTGSVLRHLGGGGPRWRPRPLDGPLLAFAVLATVWPVTWLMLRGIRPTGPDLAEALPVIKLLGIALLVRYAVRTDGQLLRCTRSIIWPATALSVLAVLQTLGVGPVVRLLGTLWAVGLSDPDIAARGTTTLGSSIATGDYILIGLVLLVACRTRGLLARRECLVCGLLLTAGLLASGQFSTVVGAAVVGVVLLRRYPLRREVVARLSPLVAVALIVGAPALVGRLVQFGSTGPTSWQVRWANVTQVYLPHFSLPDALLGVAPGSVLDATETWRSVVYLESGVLELVWMGGVPLLVAFCWLSVRLLRHTGTLVGRSDTLGANASTLEAAWWLVLVLSVIDAHLFLRGTGDLLFFLVGATTGDLLARAGRPPRAGAWRDGARARRPGACSPAVAFARRTLDVVGSSLGLAVLALPLVVVAAAIRLDGPGPVLFRQERVGVDGRPFVLRKFRTMVPGVDDGAHRDMIAREVRGEDTSQGGSWKLDTAAVTRVGAWLRRTSVDELPQLINVVRGEMSLVGPRPCLTWEADMFPDEFRARFAVRPGLTGLWQVSGRSTVGTLDMLRLDVEYVRTRTLHGDLSILARTVPVLLRGDGVR